MKTNIAGLMNLIKETESKIDMLGLELERHAINKTIIELNKTENVIEDYKSDFTEELKEYEESIEKLSKYKKMLYLKNNEFKLSDGRSIQEAIVDNTNLRKLKIIYDSLLEKRESKSRITEVNNSYFISETLNYNLKDVKKKKEELENRIYQTEFEISKLNSIEFEI